MHSYHQTSFSFPGSPVIAVTMLTCPSSLQDFTLAIRSSRRVRTCPLSFIGMTQAKLHILFSIDYGYDV